MLIDLDEYRRHSHESWDQFAPNWEREHDFIAAGTLPITERLVDRLDPQPGDTLLELAAGLGDTGFAAAERIGPSGRLISTDFAEAMVDAAERACEARGLGNVECRLLDAERMDLDDASVDGVLCRFGYMLMADPAAALRETRRVLRQGGRVAFAVWAAPERNPWAAIPGRTMVERGHLPAPEPGAPGMFAMGEPERIRELVTAGGFGEPEIEEVAVRWNYVDAADHWQKTLALAAPISAAYGDLDPDEQERIRAAVIGQTADRLAPGGEGLDGVALVAVAR